MIMIYLTFLSALAISVVSGWFSVVGIMAIFSGAAIPALVMGCVLESGKLVSTSWLYRNWDKSPLLLKLPMVLFTCVLILITSMGAFGYLSRAHIGQGIDSDNNLAKIERLSQQIANEQKRIKDYEKVITQLDDAVDRYVAQNKVSTSVSLRKSQKSQRIDLRKSIDESQNTIDAYTDTKFDLESQIRTHEVEVGPVRYIAALIYKDPNAKIEDAVRVVILVIVMVLDPFAIILLIAANFSIKQRSIPNVEQFVPVQQSVTTPDDTHDNAIPDIQENPVIEIPVDNYEEQHKDKEVKVGKPTILGWLGFNKKG